MREVADFITVLYWLRSRINARQTWKITLAPPDSTSAEWRTML